jgi:hypothetical protein
MTKFFIVLLLGILLGYNISSNKIKFLFQFRCDQREQQWNRERELLRAEIFRLKNPKIHEVMSNDK